MRFEQASATAVNGIAWYRVTRATATLYAGNTRSIEEKRKLKVIWVAGKADSNKAFIAGVNAAGTTTN
jgi:hypothetical protein